MSLAIPLLCVTDSEIGTEKELSILNQKCSKEVKTPQLISRGFSQGDAQAPGLQEAWDHDGELGRLGTSVQQSLKKPHLHKGVFRNEPVLCRERPPGQKTQECGTIDGNLTLNYDVARLQRNKTVEKAFQCDICSKTFQFNSDLTRHQRSHNGENLYECGQCGWAFTHSSSLVMHH